MIAKKTLLAIIYKVYTSIGKEYIIPEPTERKAEIVQSPNKDIIEVTPMSTLYGDDSKLQSSDMKYKPQATVSSSVEVEDWTLLEAVYD
jgi:hypothetical protein